MHCRYSKSHLIIQRVGVYYRYHLKQKGRYSKGMAQVVEFRSIICISTTCLVSPPSFKTLDISSLIQTPTPNLSRRIKGIFLWICPLAILLGPTRVATKLLTQSKPNSHFKTISYRTHRNTKYLSESHPPRSTSTSPPITLQWLLRSILSLLTPRDRAIRPPSSTSNNNSSRNRFKVQLWGCLAVESTSTAKSKGGRRTTIKEQLTDRPQS